MPSNYLADDPPVFGLPYPLATGLGETASSVVDAYLKRPEGLVYETDAAGNPIYMAALTAQATYTLGASIEPGTNVSVAVSPSAGLTPYLIGEVMILDAGNAGSQEACVVAAIAAPNTITFQSVAYAHSSGAKAQTGLVLSEDRTMPNKRSIARVAKHPVTNVLSVLGRYAYGRRSDQIGGLYQEMNLLAAVQSFGGPPQWIPVPISQVDWSGVNSTGDMWIPSGLLMAYYSDVRIKYVAGFAADAVPDCVIRAAAAIAIALTSNASLAGQVNSIGSLGTKMERLFASNVDMDTRAQIAPFVARTFY